MILHVDDIFIIHVTTLYLPLSFTCKYMYTFVMEYNSAFIAKVDIFVSLGISVILES